VASHERTHTPGELDPLGDARQARPPVDRDTARGLLGLERGDPPCSGRWSRRRIDEAPAGIEEAKAGARRGTVTALDPETALVERDVMAVA
jgi:hypothetical protein